MEIVIDDREIIENGFDMKKLSKVEKSKRKNYVEEALANARLEGYQPTAADIAQWTEYVNGRQTLEETVKNLQQTALGSQK